MQTIPAINVVNFETAKKQILKAAEFSDWVQIDIADGKFAPNLTWGDPTDISKIKNQISKIKIEVHLMIEKPDDVIDDWLRAGAKRVLVHLENIRNAELRTRANDAKSLGAEIGLAINPDTGIERIVPYLKDFKFVLILAVSPGLAGQKFDEQVLEKIKFLKKNYPDVKIEVDGGINLETAKLCKEAGVDIVVSASYLFESKDPKKAYEQLMKL